MTPKMINKSKKPNLSIKTPKRDRKHHLNVEWLKRKKMSQNASFAWSPLKILPHRTNAHILFATNALRNGQKTPIIRILREYVPSM
jgi:hypothetical protein